MPPHRTRAPSPSRSPAHVRARAAALLASALGWPLPGAAQETWNSARTLELVERGRAARQEVSDDPDFLSYRADARGFVYFFVDRPDSDERTLVKADQIALEVYWRAPSDTKQRIVGLRDESVLPTNIRYHLDHLTIVQDEFGDRIRLGDGDEVAAVVHPMAPRSAETYDFRLADSLSIRYGGGTEEVRVYEVRVRPRDPDAPGFVGSVFLDRTRADIVRMSFTFTPASYVDPYLDRIRISLSNGLWEGRYWLPARQEVEIRRELPQLDFLAGSVIRGRFEIGPYEINAPIPDALFRGRTVSSVPESQREAFPFEEPLFSDLEEEGLATPESLEEVEERAREMLADRYLSGLGRVRLYVPSASHVYRWNRAEGSHVGAGAVLRPGGDLALRAVAGWSFARDEPTGHLRISRGEMRPGPFLDLYGNDLRDLGPKPGSSGLVNTLAGLAVAEDYLDPWFANGVRLGLLGERGSISLTGERHESAALRAGDPDDFRPVRPVEEGDLIALDLEGALPAPSGLPVEATLRTGLARFEDRWFGTIGSTLRWDRAEAWRRLDLSATAEFGVASGGAPAQELFLLGGRGTLLGHPYRDAVGTSYTLLRGEAARTVVTPWIRLRATVAGGRASYSRDALPDGWTGDPDAGWMTSVGTGVGLFWDVVRIDVARGLESGDWGWAISVSPRFDDWL